MNPLWLGDRINSGKFSKNTIYSQAEYFKSEKFALNGFIGFCGKSFRERYADLFWTNLCCKAGEIFAFLSQKIEQICDSKVITL